MIELDPNVELPIKTEQPLDFRQKRNHKETIKKVASDKAAKTLLVLDFTLIEHTVFFIVMHEFGPVF